MHAGLGHYSRGAERRGTRGSAAGMGASQMVGRSVVLLASKQLTLRPSPRAASAFASKSSLFPAELPSMTATPTRMAFGRRPFTGLGD